MSCLWRLAQTTVVAGLLAPTLVGLAQQGGAIRGAVVDQGGNLVVNATVVLNRTGTSDSVEVLTSSDGRYLSDDLEPGLYTITAVKEESGGDMFRVQVRDGHMVQVDFVLAPGRQVAAWLTEAAERESFTHAFTDGIAASRADRFDDAIDQFRRALAIRPTCLECNFNLAVTFVKVDRLDDAEASFKRALDIRPDYAAAYYGLSNVYTRQNRTTEAAEARGEANRLSLERLAVGRAQSEDTVARGVTLLDAGNVTDAVGRFEAALAVDSNFAPAHYWLGVSLIELDRADQARAELERYLELDSIGEFVDDAQTLLTDLR